MWALTSAAAVSSLLGRKGSWQRGLWPGLRSDLCWGLGAGLGAMGCLLGRNGEPRPDMGYQRALSRLQREMLLLKPQLGCGQQLSTWLRRPTEAEGRADPLPGFTMLYHRAGGPWLGTIQLDASQGGAGRVGVLGNPGG